MRNWNRPVRIVAKMMIAVAGGCCYHEYQSTQSDVFFLAFLTLTGALATFFVVEACYHGTSGWR